ncbi:SDR family NAD(P)-dependent oxidoreductase [Ectobacillus funiculus]|uniref:SDR family NAD(P)-dependent oxidoreductase n=1 Tax=Ectobacillus funiculus TaxID=137993 RepID=UPI00397D82F0
MSVKTRIAIVGMSCRVPGAHTLQGFWELVSEGKLVTGSIPLERFDRNMYEVCWGLGGKGENVGALVEIPEIDYRDFPIPPEQIRHMHPMEKVGLSVMHEALRDGGIKQGTELAAKGRVYVASNTFGPSPETDHGPRIRQGEFTHILELALQDVSPRLASIRDEVLALHKQTVPPIRPDTMTTSASIVAGRIANLYNMHGGHAAIDAGTCSSLAAVEEAVLALRENVCEFAVVAGISPLITASSIVEYMEDPSFSFMPVLGEGGAAIVLMRENDIGERKVYGYIEGIASSVIHNRTNERDVALAVEKAARQALQRAGISSGSVTRIESRNRGLSFWEKAELKGLSSVYEVQQREGNVSVTSCVPHIGFLQAASGMIAIVREALTLFYNENTSDFSAVSDTGIAPAAYHAILSARAISLKHQVGDLCMSTEPIAIVGMGAIVPGSGNLELFWKHTKLGYRSFGNLPERKWSFDKIIAKNEELNTYAPSRLAGVVQIPELNTEEWGLSAEELSCLDGGVTLSLLAAMEAAGQAGLTNLEADKSRIDVVFGQLPIRESENAKNKLVFFTDYMKRVRTVFQKKGVSSDISSRVLQSMISHYKQENVETYDFYAASTGITNAYYVAKVLGAGGSILSVDATCASSLAAVENAVHHLRANLADVVIAGGVAHHLVPEYNLTLHVIGALSTKGIPPFHQDSDGFVPAEGAGAIVLKRLSDAIRDNNHIYAVIGGIGASSDGRGTSVLAPSSQGQKRSIERAIQAAHLKAADLSHIEAHGTGTRLGDETEMSTYQMVFGDYHNYKPYSIGAIKSQIGHLSSAAGIIGLIKTVLALYEKVIPPSYTDRRSSLLLSNLATEARIWGSREEGTRRAGVSAFGLGGINYFLVLEEWKECNKETMPALFSQPIHRPLHPLQSDRFTVELVPVSLPQRTALFPLQGKRIVLVQDGGDKWRVYQKSLEQRGATVLSLFPAEVITEEMFHTKLALWEKRYGELNGILDLRALQERPELLRMPADKLSEEIGRMSDFTFMLLRYFYDRFEQAKPLTSCYIAVTCLGGNLGLTDCDYGNVLGAFLQGVLKSIKQELPAVLAKTIDFPAHALMETMISSVIQEVEDGNDRMEVAYGDRRYVVHHKQANFSDQTPLARFIREGDVYVFSGGGRGIVFECAVALALLGVTVIVCGRTKIEDESAPWLEMDDEEFAAYEREQLIKQHQTVSSFTPASFKKAFARLVKERELYQNMKRAKRLGIVYEVCDINDRNQVHDMVQDILNRYGRLDGVIHGAMVEWSMIIPKKTKEIIQRTIETKVIGMCHLLEATKNIPLQSFLCFGSGAGRFGNKGQADYSAANSLMSALLVAKCRQQAGLHHATLNWTAWQSVGAAVSDPSVTEALKSSGVPFTSTEEGVYWFISELTLGRDKEVLNVREKFLRKWPFSGAEADGQGKRLLVFQDRHIPINSGDWPFIDSLKESTLQTTVIERTITREKDLYLEQHCLDGIPIFPMVCHLEMLAEAAAVSSPGWTVQSVQQFQVVHPVKLFSDQPVIIRAEASLVEEKNGQRIIAVRGLTDVFVKGRILQKDRVTALALFTFTKQGTDIVKRFIPAVKGTAYASVYDNLRYDALQIGPLFCRAGEYMVNRREGTAEAAPPIQRKLFSFTSAPTFQIDPFLVDIAMQIAVNVDSFHSSEVSLPVSMETILFGRRRRDDERVKVYSRICERSDTDITSNIYVIGENGDTIMEIDKFLARRIIR